jgi:hypothetical protein
MVGGATKVHPTARVAMKILNVASAPELAQVMAAVGLAQNLAAINALATVASKKGTCAARPPGGHGRWRQDEGAKNRRPARGGTKHSRGTRGELLHSFQLSVNSKSVYSLPDTLTHRLLIF